VAVDDFLAAGKPCPVCGAIGDEVEGFLWESCWDGEKWDDPACPMPALEAQDRAAETDRV